MSDRPAAYTPGQGMPPTLPIPRPMNLPIALPAGSTAPTALSQVSRESDVTAGTNTPSLPSSVRPARRRRRIDADVLLQIAAGMPERDREVLDRIAEHRYLTTHQLQAFVFTSHASDDSAARTTRYVLKRLERTALVRALGRRIGGVRAGSSARVWQLAPAGARLLKDEGTTYRTHEPSQRFLAHCLAVGDVHLGLRSLRASPEVSGVTVQTEPASWRRYTGSGGEARWLQPDLAATLTTAEYTDRWFIEVDLGTESLPTLLKKCGQYETYRASGIEQSEHRTFPLVLWVFTKPERAARLRTAVSRSPRLTPQLYRYADPTALLDIVREPNQ